MKPTPTTLALSITLLLPIATLPRAGLAQPETPPKQLDTPQTVALSIPASSLEAALVRFSTQTGITVSFTPEIVEGQQAQGLTGSFTPSEALERLLASSGLQAQWLGTACEFCNRTR
ncbi:hypothetical protein FT643_18010 [Ketobacter sp. MCCC 1A13808]|uniref:STN domain-containing protein n=1 Tax=Ketobacter sp. MCCC 1A13808 TaxID=2602738 RepID=UPI000F14E69F|nr:STN domain-containing protein [Ketobacter sp. MCCC 1A13808]MVF14036.1 hypothetical protein [Ketobacter sp. MCCC 1A13808]RLP55066.1 MAG: hypothetical protein D6160_07470 [Ketobacter sp.]